MVILLIANHVNALVYLIFFVFLQMQSYILCDLTADGLDEKIVQRRDGTAVYITQDIGLHLQKYEKYKIEIPIMRLGSQVFMRYSINGFNSQADLDHLFDGIKKIQKETSLIE